MVNGRVGGRQHRNFRIAVLRTPVLISMAIAASADWLARWRGRFGDVVEPIPLQDPAVAVRFPQIPRQQLERAVHLIAPDGEVFRGAQAVARMAALGGRPVPLWMHLTDPAQRPRVSSCTASWRIIGRSSGARRLCYGAVTPAHLRTRERHGYFFA